MTQSWWLIEMLGPCYLAVRQLGGYEFYWSREHSEGIRFADRGQADMAMMAIRQLRGDLFPACLPDSPRAVEHMWTPGEGVKRMEPTYRPEESLTGSAPKPRLVCVHSKEGMCEACAKKLDDLLPGQGGPF
jgi:hypothetical protein